MSELIARQVTAMVITFNEAPNIARCLDRLGWASRVLIIDSGSNDETLEIARSYPNVDIVERPFDDFASQCNFGLSRIDTRWVLSLDADYELSAALEAEFSTLRASTFAAYEASFVYCVCGNPLGGTLYPPRRVLYRRDCARYRNEGHGHRVEIEGSVGRLKGKIHHDDRKPLSRWLSSQQRYAAREADYLLVSNRGDLRWADRIRLMAWPAPIAVFLYTLILKRCLIDGWPGWLYVLQRTLAETMIALELVDRKINATGPSSGCD